MKKLSFKIAYCGIATAMCLVIMFLVGVIPFSMYLMPVISAVILLFIREELGAKWAWLSFAAVGLLSLMISPDWESKMLFISTLGWYPLAREYLIKIKPKWLSFIVRIALLNLTAAVCYFVLIKLLGMTELLETGGSSILVFIISTIFIAEVFFVIFDLLIARLSVYYRKILSKKLRKRIK